MSSATSGHSTAHHIAYLLLENAAGVKFKYIHTKGGSEAVPDGGRRSCEDAARRLGRGGGGNGQPGQAASAGGDVRRARCAASTDLPTFKEKGWNVEYGAWRGFVAPKGLPKDVKEKLSEALIAAMRSDSVKDKFAKADYTIQIKSAQEFDALLKEDYRNVKRILDQLKAQGGK